MYFLKPKLDRREDYVRRTIMAIKAMGLECDRTNRTGEFRITKRNGLSASFYYASSPESAIALANRLVKGG